MTGVQTCALPILRILAKVPLKDVSMKRVRVEEFGESKGENYG